MTLDDDLAGFWDMVYLQVEDMRRMFSELEEMRANGWTSVPKISKKATEKKKTPTTTEKSAPEKTTPIVKSSTSSKARADAARQRLLEAKRNAVAQIKQTESEQVTIFGSKDNSE